MDITRFMKIDTFDTNMLALNNEYLYKSILTCVSYTFSCKYTITFTDITRFLKTDTFDTNMLVLNNGYPYKSSMCILIQHLWTIITLVNYNYLCDKREKYEIKLIWHFLFNKQ